MQFKQIDCDYFLRFDKGEEIVSKLIEFVKSEKIKAGVISGIGALTDVELGYFDRQSKVYNRRKFPDVYELISLNGNISYLGDDPIIHAHCLLGQADYSTVGGHLFSGVVAVTGEIFIKTFPNKSERRLDSDFNLNLLDLK